MTKLSEDFHAGSAQVHEEEGYYARAEVTIGENQNIKANQVLGQITPVAPTLAVSAPVKSGAGNGVLTKAAPAFAVAAQPGNYVVTCTTVAANGGIFSVTKPDGTPATPPTATVGTPYVGDVRFTIADGTTDFALGDSFSLGVSNVDGTSSHFNVFDPGASDGTESAGGVAIYPAVTGAGEVTTIAAWVNGPCTLREADLVWPVGLTAVQKGEAIADLKALGIKLR